MLKFDYNELYSLLYNMEKVKNLTELSEHLYCSTSKCSKMIKDYELRLKVQLYTKGNINILSDDGKKLLDQIGRPISELRELIQIEYDSIGIDENLIEELGTEFSDYQKQFSDCNSLIDLYKSGKLDKIIVSSDFEKEFDYRRKKLISQKRVYYIRNKDSNTEFVYANDSGCPIRKKLEVNNIKIDETLKQSIAICKMVRLGEGTGYTFSIDTLDSNQIKIQEVKALTINFFLYTKY